MNAEKCGKFTCGPHHVRFESETLIPPIYWMDEGTSGYHRHCTL